LAHIGKAASEQDGIRPAKVAGFSPALQVCRIDVQDRILTGVHREIAAFFTFVLRQAQLSHTQSDGQE
jgi:hypothetical protein